MVKSQQGVNIFAIEQVGTWEVFYKDGQKSSSGSFKSGELSGLWQFWDEGGRLVEELDYISGDDYKIISAWNKEGNPMVEKGYGKYISYYDDGTMYQGGEVEDGNKSGIWKIYHPNGEIKEEGGFYEGVYKVAHTWTKEGVTQVIDGEGEYLAFFEGSDNVSEKGFFEKGLKEGIWETYHDNSTVLASQLNYLQGKLHGSSSGYYLNGIIYYEGDFKQDKREGQWSWHYESGQIESAVSFENGKKEGVQLFWGESGRESKEEVYEKGELISERLL